MRSLKKAYLLKLLQKKELQFMTNVTPDFMPHHKGAGRKLGRLSKKMAPTLSRILLRSPSDKILRYVSMYLDLVQGKGSGKGWDIDSEIKVACLHIHRKNPVVFDIGAHRGSWSKGILERFNSKCQIYQFEPSKHNLTFLREIKSSSIILIEKAVSNQEGVTTFYSTEAASDTSSLYERRESIFKKHNYEAETVELTTIDKVVSDLNLSRVDFVKMDIEGHELAALQGAKISLQNKIIQTVAFEFGGGNINSRVFFLDFWDLLHPLGYSIKRICPGGILLPIEHYYEDLEYFRGASNYVATLA